MSQADTGAYIDAVAARALGEDVSDPAAGAPDSPVVAAGIGPLPIPRGEMLDRLAEAHRHKNLGTGVRTGRLAAVRRVVYLLLRPLTREQATYNNAVLITLDELTGHVLKIRAQYEQRLTASQVLLASAEVRLEETAAEVERLRAAVAELQAGRRSTP